MLIGSHVSFSGKTPFKSAVEQALSYDATTFMIYTGAPQNTIRRDINMEDVKEAHQLLNDNNIKIKDIVVHAPYIVNLANSLKPETRTFGREFLIKELNRVNTLGPEIVVLHPGSHVKQGFEVGANLIIEELKIVFEKTKTAKIALETMAGKGSEVGRTFEEIAYLLKGLEKYSDRVGVCLDTCHIHDAGYDVKENFDKVLDEFNEKVGLNRLLCVHVNDSKNIRGATKDRHENIGYGEIGFEALSGVFHHPKLKSLSKILETPYVNGNAPYKEEIKMIKNNEFKDWKKEQ